MKYHNGVLRADQDSTHRIKLESWNRKLTWVEYLPMVVLGLLMAGLLIACLVLF